MKIDHEMDTGLSSEMIAGLSLIGTWFVTQIIFVIYAVYSMNKIREEIVNKGRLISLMPNFIGVPISLGVPSQSQTLPPAYDEPETSKPQPPAYTP